MRTRAGAEPPSLEDQLEDYLAELRVRRVSQSTARLVLPGFLAYVREAGVDELGAVSEEHVTAYARRLRERPGRWGRPLAASTLRTYLTAVRGFFAWAQRRGRILLSPARELALPRVARLASAVPSPAVVRRLLLTPSPFTAPGRKDRAIVELLYGTGLRASECCRLDLGDVDLAQQALVVRSGKGKRDRVVPLGGAALEALADYLREGRPELLCRPGEQALLLTSRGGRRYTVTGLDSLLRRLCRHAASPLPISPHVLRHACATHLLAGGADVRHVQLLLGHRRIETTALYTRVQTADLAQVLARAHPRERAWARRQARRGEKRGRRMAPR